MEGKVIHKMENGNLVLGAKNQVFFDPAPDSVELDDRKTIITFDDESRLYVGAKNAVYFDPKKD